MKDEYALDALVKWLKKDGNSVSKLAVNLGYKTSNTISNWLRRKSIPEWQRSRLLDLITNKEQMNEQVKPSKKRKSI